jgi:hypothetical protein
MVSNQQQQQQKYEWNIFIYTTEMDLPLDLIAPGKEAEEE